MASPSGSSPLTALPPDAVPALTAAGTIKVAKACQNCKRRKKRCDGNGLVPCDRCTKLGDTCVYVAEKKRGPKKKDDMTAAAAVAAAVPCDTPSSSTASAPNPNGTGRDSMSTSAAAPAALPTPPDAALASPRSSSTSTLPAASTTSSSSGDLASLLTPSSASIYTSSAAGSFVDLPYLPGIQPSPMPVPRSLVTPVPMSAQPPQRQQVDPYQALASSFSAPLPPSSLPHAPLTHGGDEAYQVAGAVLDAWPDFPAVPEPGSAEAAAIVQALRAPDRKRARNNLGTSQPAPTPDLGLGDFAAALDALSEFIGPDGASGAVLPGANAATPADLLASIMASSTMAPTTPTPAFAVPQVGSGAVARETTGPTPMDVDRVAPYPGGAAPDAVLGPATTTPMQLHLAPVAGGVVPFYHASSPSPGPSRATPPPPPPPSAPAYPAPPAAPMASRTRAPSGLMSPRPLPSSLNPPTPPPPPAVTAARRPARFPGQDMRSLERVARLRQPPRTHHRRQGSWATPRDGEPVDPDALQAAQELSDLASSVVDEISDWATRAGNVSPAIDVHVGAFFRHFAPLVPALADEHAFRRALRLRRVPAYLMAALCAVTSLPLIAAPEPPPETDVGAVGAARSVGRGNKRAPPTDLHAEVLHHQRSGRGGVGDSLAERAHAMIVPRLAAAAPAGVAECITLELLSLYYYLRAHMAAGYMCKSMSVAALAALVEAGAIRQHRQRHAVDDAVHDDDEDGANGESDDDMDLVVLSGVSHQETLARLFWGGFVTDRLGAVLNAGAPVCKSPLLAVDAFDRVPPLPTFRGPALGALCPNTVFAAYVRAVALLCRAECWMRDEMRRQQRAAAAGAPRRASVGASPPPPVPSASTCLVGMRVDIGGDTLAGLHAELRAFRAGLPGAQMIDTPDPDKVARIAARAEHVARETARAAAVGGAEPADEAMTVQAAEAGAQAVIFHWLMANWIFHNACLYLEPCPRERWRIIRILVGAAPARTAPPVSCVLRVAAEFALVLVAAGHVAEAGPAAVCTCAPATRAPSADLGRHTCQGEMADPDNEAALGHGPEWQEYPSHAEVVRMLENARARAPRDLWCVDADLARIDDIVAQLKRRKVVPVASTDRAAAVAAAAAALAPLGASSSATRSAALDAIGQGSPRTPVASVAPPPMPGSPAATAAVPWSQQFAYAAAAATGTHVHGNGGYPMQGVSAASTPRATPAPPPPPAPQPPSTPRPDVLLHGLAIPHATPQATPAPAAPQPPPGITIHVDANLVAAWLAAAAANGAPAGANAAAAAMAASLPAALIAAAASQVPVTTAAAVVPPAAAGPALTVDQLQVALQAGAINDPFAFQL
ncbi:hypothetical protein GGF32_007361 [Allomyces javanicus]|nr:hypothetical protein GGF32_007361 [Allomyces javanicus]